MIQIRIIDMKTVAQVCIGAGINVKPSGKDFLKGCKLHEVVRCASVQIITSHDLGPKQSSIPNLKHRRDVARNVCRRRAAIDSWHICPRVPDLEYSLPCLRVPLKGGTDTL